MAEPILPSDEAHEMNRRAFCSELDRLLEAHEGEFALFHRGACKGTFDSLESAYARGVEQFGLEPFYVGHVVRTPVMVHVPALVHGLIDAHI